MFQLVVHPEAQRWVPSEAYLSKLGEYFPDGKVSLWPRRMTATILGRPTVPYEFRAFTRNGEANVFVDPTETPQSIAWLMAHELCHQIVENSPTINAAFNDAKPVDMKPSSDEFHYVDAEERFCDGIATKLLGYRKDRAWWRKRVASRL